jgi:hypothetical protein
MSKDVRFHPSEVHQDICCQDEEFRKQEKNDFPWIGVWNGIFQQRKET